MTNEELLDLLREARAALVDSGYDASIPVFARIDSALSSPQAARTEDAERQDSATEVERLKAREESLVQQSVAQIGMIGRLQEEVERLRDALEDIASGDYSDPLCMKTPEARARAALEIK
jgi:hypothetical protein